MTMTIKFLLGLIAIVAIALASYRFGVSRAKERRYAEPHVGKSETYGYRIRLRVIAADTLEPVEGATLEHILIGEDGGDGGFNEDVTDDSGCITTEVPLRPGRHMIYIKAPKGSRYATTQFTEDETYLVVRKDGTYSPAEFRMLVRSDIEARQ